MPWAPNIAAAKAAHSSLTASFAPADVLRHREAWLHDLQAQLRVSERLAFYGGVNNLANQKPDEDAYDTPVPALGRFFYVGVRTALQRSAAGGGVEAGEAALLADQGDERRHLGAGLARGEG